MIRIKFKKDRLHYSCIRPRAKVKKMYWDFHKGDSDYNPSVPHGHSLDGKYKLELWSGKIYEISSGKIYGIARPKEMQSLYSLRGFREFVDECRSEYRKMHPNVTLQPLTLCSGITMLRSAKGLQKIVAYEKYVIGIQIVKDSVLPLT